MIEMILRVANENDIQLLFDWANDPKVRENSFSTDYIQYADHIKWFTAIMNDKHRKQYIAEVNGQPVGQIRVAVDGEKAMIGYSVAKEFRGKVMRHRCSRKLSG